MAKAKGFHLVTSMTQPYRINAGQPFPLGVTQKAPNYHFSIFIEKAQSVLLFILIGQEWLKFPLNQTGDVFHVVIGNLPSKFLYYYEIQRDSHPPLKALDPYCKALSSHYPFGDFNQAKTEVYSVYLEGLKQQNNPIKKFQKNALVIYELHIRGFTVDPSSQVANPGTFRGAIEKIPYLKSIGINAVEVMPIMEFNECEVSFVDPQTKERLKNFWGYSTLNFFSIMKRYASNPDEQAVLLEFQAFIEACHEAEIAVILDVVYNHMGEDHVDSKSKSLGILAKNSYYITENGHHTNYSGCGNTINTNHPITTDLIIASLRYFLTVFQVDGFRFDLASIFMRDESGTPVPHSLIIEKIQKDPLLSESILIAEPWDAAGLYQVGSFPSPFMEWNGWYRDTVRQFFNMKNVYIPDLIECLKGSPRLYSRNKTPADSINFITCHDGFTLYDLVSYVNKHNQSNGEENRDGNNHNLSINFGVEGFSHDPTIQFLRKTQILNFFTFLFCSFGTPMIQMGDERGHSKQGNNNTWCQDNQLNYLNWNEFDETLLSGLKYLISLRKSLPFFNQETFSFIKEVEFRDAYGNTPDPHSYGNFLAMTFYDPIARCQAFFAFNTSSNPFIIQLPPLKNTKSVWKLYWNTYEFLSKKEQINHPIDLEYPITGQTAIIALSFDH